MPANVSQVFMSSIIYEPSGVPDGRWCNKRGLTPFVAYAKKGYDPFFAFFVFAGVLLESLFLLQHLDPVKYFLPGQRL